MSERQNCRARLRLRSATADDHARVDAAFGSFDLSSVNEYTRFLLAQARACLPVEAALERAGIATLLPDWADRRRGESLRADLAELGIGTIDADEFRPLRAPAETIGAAYVLEGSKLGGRMLARGVPEHFPRRFIEAGSSNLWRDFIATLENTLTSAGTVEQAVGGARAVFAVFEASARREHAGEQ